MEYVFASWKGTFGEWGVGCYREPAKEDSVSMLSLLYTVLHSELFAVCVHYLFKNTYKRLKLNKM